MAFNIEVQAREQPGDRCAYCHESFDEQAFKTACPNCKTWIHGSCLLYANKCPTNGCDTPRVAFKSARAKAPKPSTVPYLCPVCREPRVPLTLCENCGHDPRRRCPHCASDLQIHLSLKGEELGTLSKSLVRVGSERFFVSICSRCGYGTIRPDDL